MESFHQVTPEQIEQEKINRDPARNFLRAHGFDGDPGIKYSLDVLNTEDGKEQTETKTFSNYDDLQEYIKNNPNNIANKRLVEAGSAPYRIDYGSAVYEWSKNLTPDQQQTLEKGWDIVGQDAANMNNFLAGEQTNEGLKNGVSGTAEKLADTYRRERFSQKIHQEASENLKKWRTIETPEGAVAFTNKPEGEEEPVEQEETIQENNKDVEKTEDQEVDKRTEEDRSETPDQDKNVDIPVNMADEIKKQLENSKPMDINASEGAPKKLNKFGELEDGLDMSKFFNKLAKNPEIFIDRIKDSEHENEENAVTPKKILMAVMNAYELTYPDIGERVKRLEEIVNNFESYKAQISQEKPGKEDAAYEAFAVKRLANEMSKYEREALTKTIQEKATGRAGNDEFGFQLIPTSEEALSQFVKFVKSLNTPK